MGVKIGDNDLLIAQLIRIQPRIGILFKLAEPGDVPLGLEIVEGAKEPNARLIIGKEEAAEIAGEPLNADARGPEIMICGKIGQVLLVKKLLDAHPFIMPVAPFADVGVDQAQLLSVDVIDVDDGGETKFPIARLIRGIALEKLHREDEVL